MGKRGKPQGEKVGWKRLSTRYPFVTQWMRLRQDRVRIEGKGEFTFTYREAPDAVAVVPVTRDGEMVLLKQYRYTVDDWCYEVPAGGTHDRRASDLEEVARDELHEEIGATCGQLIAVTTAYTLNAISDELMHVYLALDVELAEEPKPEKTELIEVCPVPVAEALRMAHSGEIRDGMSALVIMLCEDMLREHGLV